MTEYQIKEIYTILYTLVYCCHLQQFQNGGNEILFDSDSDDEQFYGFVETDLNNNSNNYIVADDIILTEEDLQQIEGEVLAEEADPNFEAYEDAWLMRFRQIVGTIGIDEPTPYAIFSRIFDDNIIQLLVRF